MAYMDLVREYSENNKFEYNTKELYSQVKKAMKKRGSARVNALGNVLKKNYPLEAGKYEPMKREMKMKLLTHDPNDREFKQLEKTIEKMALPMTFLEQYINIINAMASDIKPSYKPAFMLGLDELEAKTLLSDHLNSFTRDAETMVSLKTFGWAAALEDVEFSRYSSVNEKVYDYATADPDKRGEMKNTFIRMKLVKEELSKMNFFKKYFTSEGSAMRNYVKVAEKALRDVNFPRIAGLEAVYEYSMGVATEPEYQIAHETVKNLYQAEEEKKKLANSEPQKQHENQELQRDKEVNNVAKKVDFKKPTSLVEMKKIFSNSAVAKSTKEQLMAAMEKATNASADKKNKADSIYRTLGSMISDTWTNKNEMHTHAIDIFKRAYDKIGRELEGMTEKDKIVAAQQMTDIILNTYSPVASDKNLSNDEIAAQYGNNYAIRKMDIEAMQKFMDYNGDMNELLTEVKSELGIDASKPEEQKQEEKMPEKVEFRPNTFNENNADKSEKVDVLEHDDKQLKV